MLSTTERGDQAGFSFPELLIVVTVMMIIGGMAVASFNNATFRLTSDADAIKSQLFVARLRAANQFTRTQLVIDPVGRNFTTQRWDPVASAWVADGNAQPLSTGVDFGVGAATVPPPGLIPPIAQSTQVIFNSRGVPVDGAGTPVGTNAVYITNQQMTLAVTVSPGGRIAVWRFIGGAWGAG